MIGEYPQRAPPAHWSLAGLVEGARLSLPAAPGIIVFAAAYGSLAAQKGLTLVDAALMSALVFAGASQFVATEIWTEPLTLATIATLALVTATVNMRLLLMSASLRPWLGQLPVWQTYPTLYFMTDAGWLIAARHQASGGSNVAVFLGSGLCQWVLWVGATLPGYLLGAVIADPRRYGLDLVMPAIFVVLLAPLWRGYRRAIPWFTAAVVALGWSLIVGGWWFIIVGAVAGSVVAGFADEF